MNPDIIGILFGLSILLLMVIGGGLTWRQEIRTWNAGMCAKNGLPWVHFDNSSQGCRGYVAGDIYTWITYPGVDAK